MCWMGEVASWGPVALATTIDAFVGFFRDAHADATGAASPLTSLGLVQRLGMAALLGMAIGGIYQLTYTGSRRRYRKSMVQTQILLCLGGALIWVIVGNNLARAFGLGGALSLIRFRTPVPNPKDTTVVFFSIIIGMAAGLGQYATAAIGTGVFGVVMVLLWAFNIGRRPRRLARLSEEPFPFTEPAPAAEAAAPLPAPPETGAFFDKG